MRKNLVIFFYLLYIFSGMLKWIPTPIDITIGTLILVIFFGVREIDFSFVKRNYLELVSLIIIIIIATVSILYTPASLNVWLKKYNGLIIGFIAFMIPLIMPGVFNNPDRFLSVCRGLFFIALGLIALEYFRHGFDRIIFGTGEKIPNYLKMGSLVGFGAIVSLSYKSRVTQVSAIIICIILLVFLAGRGPFFFLIIIFFLRYIFIFNGKIGYLLGYALLVLPILNLIDLSKIQAFTRLINRIAELSESFNGSNNSRIEHFSHAINMIIEAPLLGGGIGSYGHYFYGYDVFSYPHNIILEFGAELGLFSILLFILLVVSTHKKVFNVKLSSSKHLIWMILAFFLLNSFKSGGMDMFRFVTSWWAVLLVSINLKSTKIYKKKYKIAW